MPVGDVQFRCCCHRLKMHGVMTMVRRHGLWLWVEGAVRLVGMVLSSRMVGTGCCGKLCGRLCVRAWGHEVSRTVVVCAGVGAVSISGGLSSDGGEDCGALLGLVL
jgi:hypothetical protein